MNRFRCLSVALTFAAAATSGLGADRAAPLPVREIVEEVFVYEAPYALASPRNTGAIANAGFIVGRDGVAVIDTQATYLAGRRLLAAVEAQTALPVRYVVNTHFHPDHVLGNAAFARDGVTFVGHENLPEALRSRKEQYLAATKALVGAEAFAGTEIVFPTMPVRGRLELDLGNRRLILESWPTAHTNSDLSVLDEKTGTWFLGDTSLRRSRSGPGRQPERLDRRCGGADLASGRPCRARRRPFVAAVARGGPSDDALS